MTALITAIIPVYRNPAGASSSIRSLLRQNLPERLTLEIIVVDDGSQDGTSDLIEAEFSGDVTIIVLDKNIGRSSARNAGARIARGNYLLFLDCDCIPCTPDFLMAHLSTLATFIASAGEVCGSGNDFWGKYQACVAKRRRSLHSQGLEWIGSSANLAVRKGDFCAVNGFNEQYRGYGFEDRDMLLRLAVRGRIGLSNGSKVRHSAQLTMADIAVKLREAGQKTAPIFRQDHPDAYRKLGYSAIDCTIHPILRYIAKAALPLTNWATTRFDKFAAILPFPIAIVLVRIITALHFMRGTYEAGMTADTIKGFDRI